MYEEMGKKQSTDTHPKYSGIAIVTQGMRSQHIFAAKMSHDHDQSATIIESGWPAKGVVITPHSYTISDLPSYNWNL